MHAPEHGGRRSRRRHQPVPVVRNHIRITQLARRRHLGQRRRPLRARHRERLELARLDVRQHDRHIENSHLHLAAQQVAHRGRRAFVGYVQHVDARLGLEQLAGEMRDSARAGGAEVDLAGIRSCVGDQLGETRHRERGIHHHDLGHLDHRGDEREIPARVEGHLGQRVRRHRDRSLVVEPEGVAVGRGLGDHVDAEHAAHPALVLDDDGLAKAGAQALSEASSENIRRTSGRKTHDQAHGLGRVGLRKRRAGQQALGRSKREYGGRNPHRELSQVNPSALVRRRPHKHTIRRLAYTSSRGR